MHDERGSFDGRDIFVHESFNLADLHATSSVLCSCFITVSAGDIGDGHSRDMNDRTNEGCMTARVISGAAGVGGKM